MIAKRIRQLFGLGILLKVLQLAIWVIVVATSNEPYSYTNYAQAWVIIFIIGIVLLAISYAIDLIFD